MHRPEQRGWTGATRIISILTIVAALLAIPVTGEAATLTSLDVTENSVSFSSDAAIEKVEHFVMSDPTRLVVDLYGVSQVRPQPAIALAGGFQRLRIGIHSDKTRFVFEAAGKELPAFTLDKAARRVSISWQGPPKQAAPQSVHPDRRARLALIEIVDSQDIAVSARVRGDALAFIAEKWRYQVRIAVQPPSGLREMEHFVLPNPDRLVLELIGVVLDGRGPIFDLRDGFRRLAVDATPRAVRLEFEMEDGPLPRFTVFEAPTLGYLVVAWGAVGSGSAR